MQGAMQGPYGWRAQGLSLTRQVGSRQTARPSEQVPLGTLEWGRSRSVSGRYSVCLSVSRSVRGGQGGALVIETSLIALVHLFLKARSLQSVGMLRHPENAVLKIYVTLGDV